MSKYKITVTMNDLVGRYVAKYEDGDHSFEYVTPDWGVNRFGKEPTLVDEIDEIFSLNFLFFLKAVQTVGTPPAEAAPAA